MKCLRSVSMGLAVGLSLAAGAAAQTANSEWRSHSGDPGSTKYSPLDQIWIQEPPPGPDALRGNSTRGVAYWRGGGDERIFVQRGESLIALNAKTGQPYPTFVSTVSSTCDSVQAISPTPGAARLACAGTS
jgi:glucose dehydrogenase